MDLESEWNPSNDRVPDICSDLISKFHGKQCSALTHRGNSSQVYLLVHRFLMPILLAGPMLTTESLVIPIVPLSGSASGSSSETQSTARLETRNDRRCHDQR